MLADNEFAGFYPRDRRTDEQRSDDLRDAFVDKLSDPEWLGEALADTDLDRPLMQLFADGDDIAFCAKLREAFNKRAEREAAQEVA